MKPRLADHPSNTATSYKQLLFIASLIGLPFGAYMIVVTHYCVNVPYLDDYTVVLAQMNTVLSTNNLGEKIIAIFTPNAGHLPALTRLIALGQIKYLGGINFKDSLIAANAGWVLTAAMLIIYFRRSLSLSWIALLPIPFLMLNINHWESMDFITPAWQMYWGSAFFPTLCFIALIERKLTISVYAFVGALFLSSGGLPIYPLAIGYCLFRKRWEDAVGFMLRAAIPLLIFFYFNPPMGNVSKDPDFILMLKYIPAFMGNLVSTGTWDMTDIAWLQIALGLMIICLGIRMLLTAKISDLSKLIFVYVMILGGMAAYLRGGVFAYVVSRYALFASLAATCVYAVYAAEIQNSDTTKKWFFPVASVVAVLLWAHSLYICQTPLKLNMGQRLLEIDAYLHPENLPEKYIPNTWDTEQAHPIINTAKTLGVYNPEVMRIRP